MWGNTFGWILSAGLTAVAAVLGYVVVQSGAPTPPSGWALSAGRPLGAISVTAVGAVPVGKDLSNDAGVFYRKIVDECEADDGIKKRDYDAAQKDDSNAVLQTAEKLPGFDNLLKGAECQSMDLYKSHPDDAVGYAGTLPALDDLQLVAKAALTVAIVANGNKDYATAKKYAGAVMVLGYDLYRERVVFVELDAAEQLMGAAGSILQGIADSENNESGSRAQKTFSSLRVDEYKKSILPVWEVLGSLGDQTLDEHAGDFFTLAADTKADRLWRVEAIRRIGRLQFNARNKADQTRAPKFLNKLATDPAEDPVVKVAAVKARDITRFENQSVR